MFLALVAIIWLILGVTGAWMLYNERRLRIDTIRQQVTLVTSRIVTAYNNDDNITEYFEFVDEYFIKHPLYSYIRVSIYHNGRLVDHIGEPIRPSDARSVKKRTTDLGDNGTAIPVAEALGTDTEAQRRHDNLYYGEMRSTDGRLTVYTMLPFSSELMGATATGSLLILLLALAVIGTVLAWIMSRRLGRNIKNLHAFAERASSDPNFVPNVTFPNDELGDISRHIVNFYNQRNSDMVKLKREHNIAFHALMEKARMKRELTNNINHELKTPISVIKGYLDTIDEHPDMDEESRRHFLKKVSEHVERLSQLINDISSITRLEYGSQMINTEPVDFHEVVFQAVTDFETSGLLGTMVFNYDVPVYCRVIGNRQLLTGVITNLTKNAVAYSKGTECNLILTDRDEHFYHFAFYDNGVGVKPESLPHLFDRFFREDTGRSRKKGGTGLGLPIVQNTIEALGGTILVENRSGGGLIFRFTLRRADIATDSD